MIWRPKEGGMWDPSIIRHDGEYHVFTMYRKEGDPSHGHCFMATSEDGVHWQDRGVVLEEREREKGYIFFKCFVAHCGDRFIMDHGVARPGAQDPLRFYESGDLRHWEHITSTIPDTRWYASPGRWDHMYILPKEPGNHEAGYWGHVVAVAKPELPRGVGMMESDDGREWHVLPPAPVEWGDTPPRDFEWGGCERIGGKYYLIGGTSGYVCQGYSMYTFVADYPCGPFRPDAEAYRLSGSSKDCVAWLAAWARGKDNELLVSNYASVAPGDNHAPWMLPLRKPVVGEDGHLRLAWWPGNRTLKGENLALEKDNLALPEGDGKSEYHTAWLNSDFNLDEGVVVEGAIRANADAPCPAAGFLFDEGTDQTMALLLGIGAREGRETHIGRLRPDGQGGLEFLSQDVTGSGCATVTGIEDGRTYGFRLLVRMTFFELYVDDMLVQTFVYRPASGRIGVVARGARLEVAELKAWRMSLPASK